MTGQPPRGQLRSKTRALRTGREGVRVPETTAKTNDAIDPVKVQNDSFVSPHPGRPRWAVRFISSGKTSLWKHLNNSNRFRESDGVPERHPFYCTREGWVWGGESTSGVNSCSPVLRRGPPSDGEDPCATRRWKTTAWPVEDPHEIWNLSTGCEGIF